MIYKKEIKKFKKSEKEKQIIIDFSTIYIYIYVRFESVPQEKLFMRHMSTRNCSLWNICRIELMWNKSYFDFWVLPSICPNIYIYIYICVCLFQNGPILILTDPLNSSREPLKYHVNFALD